ncbi:hypothetical protein TNCV_4869071 [Trichonephila clavipes]|nr:hypothetical protein TNCV_4869071 [Trichonephila clavipes]
MPTEQEAKPAVVTPSLQQWRGAHRPSEERLGRDPLKWLKKYDRVANFNKASTQSTYKKCIRTLPKVNPLMKKTKSVTLMKGVAEDIYQALLTREINDTASFIKWCNYIEDMKQKSWSTEI